MCILYYVLTAIVLYSFSNNNMNARFLRKSFFTNVTVVDAKQGMEPNPSTDVPVSCSLSSPISECPSARIIKVFLKKLQSAGPSEFIESIRSVFEDHNYTVTDVLNDVHHIKYYHGVDTDDEKFDEIYAFISTALSDEPCSVTNCIHIRRHYRDRGAPNNELNDVSNDDVNDIVLMDTMAMVHCYFVHSFDLNRLTKEERDAFDIELSSGIGLDGDEKTPIEDDLTESNRVLLINSILTAKREKLKIGRGDGRYRDNENDQKSEIVQIVDFTAISNLVDVDEVVLREGLSDYEKDRDRFIGDLIDVVYAKNVNEMKLWSALKMEDDAKRAVFHGILFGHFDCIQLNTANFIKLSVYIIDRKGLQIDFDALYQEVTTNDIDGRMFDKTDREHYQNMGKFSKLFKSAPNCKAQHLRQLYTALKRWQYVEYKMQKVKQQEEEHAQDTKEDENDEVIFFEPDQPLDVYEIGRRFYFWDSHRKHPDFVAPKYENMKQEVLNSPLLSGLITIRAWNELTAVIERMVDFEVALQISSNGQSEYMYHLKKREPIDANHIRSLKLYTDFTDLSAKFCAILRWADPVQIAEIAHWTRSLIETVQCFGSSLNDDTVQKTYFRGVDKTFIFRMIATRFHLPLSTTSDVK